MKEQIIIKDIFEIQRKGDLTILDSVLEYCEVNNLKPEEIGERLSSNKSFVDLFKRELTSLKVLKEEEIDDDKIKVTEDSWD